MIVTLIKVFFYLVFVVITFFISRRRLFKGLEKNNKNKYDSYNDGYSQVFLKNGKLHRIGGPAVIWKNGSKEWWVNGKLHRDDGPAYLSTTYKAWYKNGLRHRLEGPAIVYHNKESGQNWNQWWVEGKEISERRFNLEYKRE